MDLLKSSSKEGVAKLEKAVIGIFITPSKNNKKTLQLKEHRD